MHYRCIHCTCVIGVLQVYVLHVDYRCMCYMWITGVCTTCGLQMYVLHVDNRCMYYRCRWLFYLAMCRLACYCLLNSVYVL